MSVDFYPRKPQEWVTHRSRYPFQSGVASLDGPDRTRDFGSAAASAAFYAYQKGKMKRLSPHLLQDGFDLSYDESMKRAVLQDPVGLDFRLPSEMQEFLDSKAGSLMTMSLSAVLSGLCMGAEHYMPAGGAVLMAAFSAWRYFPARAAR